VQHPAGCCTQSYRLVRVSWCGVSCSNSGRLHCLWVSARSCLMWQQTLAHMAAAAADSRFLAASVAVQAREPPTPASFTGRHAEASSGVSVGCVNIKTRYCAGRSGNASVVVFGSIAAVAFAAPTQRPCSPCCSHDTPEGKQQHCVWKGLCHSYYGSTVLTKGLGQFAHAHCVSE
jgi:hypothetical protein